jgi:hypothetical protein
LLFTVIESVSTDDDNSVNDPNESYAYVRKTSSEMNNNMSNADDLESLKCDSNESSPVSSTSHDQVSLEKESLQLKAGECKFLCFTNRLDNFVFTTLGL